MAKVETALDVRHRLGDGRQYGFTLQEIKKNHCLRYAWAAEELAGRTVLDAGCGIGYGSAILAGKCRFVTGAEFNPSVVEFAAENWSRLNLDYIELDLTAQKLIAAEAVVAFEVLEHLVVPELFLCAVQVDTILLASVPNEEHAAHSPLSNPFHIRHYRHKDVEDLLDACGYDYPVWYHQDFAAVEPRPKTKAKTIVFTSRRAHDVPVPSHLDYKKALLREFLRRCNIINDLKKGERDPRKETAF